MMCAARPGPGRHLRLQPLTWPLVKRHHKGRVLLGSARYPVEVHEPHQPWAPGQTGFSRVRGGWGGCASITQSPSVDPRVSELHLLYLMDCHKRAYEGDRPQNSWFYVGKPRGACDQLYSTSAAPWNHLGNFNKYHYLGRTPKDSDLIGLGRGPGNGIF